MEDIQSIEEIFNVLQKISFSKRLLIKLTFDSLQLLEFAEKNFQESKEENFIKFYYTSLNNFLEKQGQGKTPKIDLSPDIPSDRLVARQEICKSINSINYQPPQDRFLLLIHLCEIWHLYESDLKVASGLEEVCLDLSLFKLLIASHRHLEGSLVKAQREGPRTRKAAQAIKIKTENRKKIVLAIYEHGEKIPRRAKFSEVVRIIQEQFKKSKGNRDAPWGNVPANMKIPSRDAIKKWFKEEENFDRDFKQKGRYWFKCM